MGLCYAYDRSDQFMNVFEDLKNTHLLIHPRITWSIISAKVILNKIINISDLPTALDYKPFQQEIRKVRLQTTLADSSPPD